MTIIAALSSADVLSGWTPLPPATEPELPAAATPSTLVSLGAVSDPAASTYALPPRVPPPATQWQRDNRDPLSLLMAQNFRQNALQDRFHGLGAAVLQRLGSDTSNDAQSVSLLTPLPVDSSALFTCQSSLHVRTIGGGEVTVTLSHQNDRLGVQIVSHNLISDSERAALAGLAQGFQQALDGLTSQPPNIDLTGLLHYDSQQLSAVDFQIDLKLPLSEHTRYNLHLDQQGRSLNIEGAAGSVQLNVDTRQASLWGSQSQQAATVGHYLQQFELAGQRGHADQQLIDWMKTGFTQLNHQDTPATDIWRPSTLNEDDHAMLTGIADFSLSINATPTQPNPRRLDEWQTFSYQASQQTKIEAENFAERQVEQTQQTHLSASFHSAIPGIPLDFKHGDYIYNQLEDSASTCTSFGYHKAQLAYASVRQASNQRTRQQTYLAGQKVSDTTRDRPGALNANLMPLFTPDPRADQLKTAAERQAEHQARLLQAHALIQLPELSTRLD